MPRSLINYSTREWLRLRPIIDRKNHARYQLREWIALAMNASPVPLPRIKCQKALITISFNDPQVIGWQTKLVARYVRDAIHVVIDNSTTASARDAIREICLAANIAFVQVPANPWVGHEKEGGKSHGYALNWAWQNIVLANRPLMVGFLDHDLFPVERTDPFRLLDRAIVAGLVRAAPGHRWYLWPGFAFYNMGRIGTDHLNFGRDWLDDLDTGGLNWHRLYRRVDQKDLCAARHERVAVTPDVPMTDALFERVDGWLHESRFTTDINMEPGRRQFLLGLKRHRVLEALKALPT
ncbi:hypothetical protein [Mesorhizobium sp. B2-6-2]|uniref:hypothetical protein n=1 Tax=Mesorhizobium sp. B2-6-2 TaxID=2589915 RepID=UPI00112CC5D4|nr:hypothetical protein [Mesorhizobium sp. B2-6-2]TPJ80182.1 hypothetical protein FJ419_09695 [Mesorhizobium sp. B2-6-2]